MEHDNNRSSALTPEQLALINTQTAVVVKELLSSLIGPMLAQMNANALTPEKIQALKAPWVDEKLAERNRRETAQNREEDAFNRARKRAMQAACPHQDENQKTCICIIHNYPDHQPRGICPHCHDIINPREWVIGAPDPVTGKTTATLRPAHKDYGAVQALSMRN